MSKRKTWCCRKHCCVPSVLLALALVSLLPHSRLAGLLLPEKGAVLLLAKATEPAPQAVAPAQPQAAGNSTSPPKLLSEQPSAKPADAAGPQGFFQDWQVVTPSARGRAVVAVVLLKHRSVHNYDFYMEGAPDWAKMIFAVNRAFCQKHGYKMVLREGGRASPTPWQSKGCSSKWQHESNVSQCLSNYDRDNNCWAKSTMMMQYLQRSDAPHVLILDADAALVHRERDTVQAMAKELEDAGKDILLANQDWQKNGGPSRLNCGMMFAKNTAFTRSLFKNLVESHLQGASYKGPGTPCKIECHCIQTWMKTYDGLADRLLVVSGIQYNRQECTFRCCTACPTNQAIPGLSDRPRDDPELEVLHFTSGNSRGAVK